MKNNRLKLRTKAIESYGSPHWLPQLVLSALVCFLVMFSAGVWFKMQDRKAEQQPVEQAAVNSYSWLWKTTDIKAQAMRLLIWSHLIGCWSILSGAIWAVLKCLHYRRPTQDFKLWKGKTIVTIESEEHWHAYQCNSHSCPAANTATVYWLHSPGESDQPNNILIG